MRWILHIDMDAFFASVEQRDHPELRGVPVSVGGSPAGRGVVAAASYEARAFGVRSAMAAAQAIKLCPHLKFVKPRFEIYKTVSQQVREIFEQVTDLIEPLSLDEAYLDISEHPGAAEPDQLAQDIRDQIFRQTQCTASAGIAPNKFLAKVASDMHKPNGQFMIRPEDAAAFVETLPIRKFYGIGPATEKRMLELGIQRGADLKAMSKAELVQAFGKSGNYYYNISRGLDDRPVKSERIRKSVSVEDTFFDDLKHVLVIRQELFKVCQSLEKRIERAGVKGKTVSLKIRYSDFETRSHQISLNEAVSSCDEIWPIAKSLLEQSQYRHRSVRLLGLGISHLIEQDSQDSLPF